MTGQGTPGQGAAGPGGFADGAGSAAQPPPVSGLWDKIRRNLHRVPFAEDALASAYCALDPQTPAYAKSILLGAIGYFVMPADVIPDFILGLGFTDDASVIALALGTLTRHIKPEHRDRARALLARIGN